MSDKDQSPEAPKSGESEPGSIEAFIQDQASLIVKLKAEHGDKLAAIKSPWGPIVVVKKPTYEQDLAFNAAQRHTNPVKGCEGSWLLLQNVVVYPDLRQLRGLREEHGFLFIDNLAALTQEQWGPQNPAGAKKL